MNRFQIFVKIYIKVKIIEIITDPTKWIEVSIVS